MLVTTGPRASLLAHLPPGLVTSMQTAFNASSPTLIASAPLPDLAAHLQPLGALEIEDPLFGLGDDNGAGSVAEGVGRVVVAAVAEGVGSSRDMWLFICQFFGWWVSLVWCVVAGSCMVVYRMGLNSG